MPQSYSSLWVHLVWSTKNREPLLNRTLKAEAYAVIREIANDFGIYLDSINGIEDHVHLLIRPRTDQSVADVVKTIKGNSWEHFRHDPEKYIIWQDGFAAFSISPDQVKKVRNYIKNQEYHHKSKLFADELKEIKESAKQI